MSEDTRRKLQLLLMVGLVAVVADQASKFWAVTRLTHAFSQVGGFATDFERFWHGSHPVPTEPVVVFRSFWDFSYVENPGAAWGIFAGASETVRGPFFMLMSAVAAVLILRYYFRSPWALHMRLWGLALVFGGALGNFTDRVRLRYVIDFIHWHWYDRYHFPTFNIADSAISIGVVLLLIDSFKNGDEGRVSSAAPEDTPAAS